MKTENNPVVQSVREVVLGGLPGRKDDIPLCVTPFFHVCEEILVQNGSCSEVKG